MLGIYYTNAWESKSLPFMSTTLRTEDGGKVSSLLKSAHESKTNALSLPETIVARTCALRLQELGDERHTAR